MANEINPKSEKERVVGYKDVINKTATGKKSHGKVQTPGNREEVA
jgi:hypothetical protein